MKVKECKIGKKVLYRGQVTTIKTIKNIANGAKIILSNGYSTRNKYLKPQF